MLFNHFLMVTFIFYIRLFINPTYYKPKLKPKEYETRKALFV